MINLLPDNEKKLIEHEYHMRLIAISMFLFFVLTVIAAVLLLPSYVLSTYKVRAAEAIAERDAGSDRQNLVAEVRNTRTIMGVLKPSKQTTSASELVAVIGKHKGDVSITSIDYQLKPGGGFSATVLGIAKNRQSLVALRNGLKGENIIKKAELPVSDLAKDADITFSLSLEGDF